MYSDNNGTEKLVIESEVKVYDKLSFKRFADEKRKELETNVGTNRNRKYYPLKKIADNLGLTVEMLQKRINKEKPSKSRDCIIAICAALGLDSFDTNDALIMYDYMPSLDPDNPREAFLIEKLKKLRGTPADIKDLNRQLKAHNFSELRIIDHRDKGKEITNEIKGFYPYKIIRKVVQTYLDEGDQYDSIETAYKFRHRCVAVAILGADEKEEYILKADGDGYLSINTKDSPIPKTYKNSDESGVFKDYFSDLIMLANQEKQRVKAQLFDSRNYQGRLGAKLKDDMIYIYYERYNYELPERNEYYLMEHVNGHLRLSVSYQSMFMQEHLTSDEYLKYYGSLPKASRESYDSVAKIMSDSLNPSRPGYIREMAPYRKQAFESLSKIIESALVKIKKRTLFVRNLEAIWDNPAYVCRYFSLENEFDCTYDDEYGEMVLGKDEAELTDADGHSLIITFDEVKRAFELGFADSSQICRVKREKGTIESVLS